MTSDDFEKLGELGIVEITLKEEVYEDLVDQHYPNERSAHGGHISTQRKNATINRIVTTSGDIKVNKEIK